MARRPPSAISMFTAVGIGIALIPGIIGLFLGWVPTYFVFAFVVLAVLIGFNLWASRGSRGGRD